MISFSYNQPIYTLFRYWCYGIHGIVKSRRLKQINKKKVLKKKIEHYNTKYCWFVIQTFIRLMNCAIVFHLFVYSLPFSHICPVFVYPCTIWSLVCLLWYKQMTEKMLLWCVGKWTNESSYSAWKKNERKNEWNVYIDGFFNNC